MVMKWGHYQFTYNCENTSNIERPYLTSICKDILSVHCYKYVLPTVHLSITNLAIVIIVSLIPNNDLVQEYMFNTIVYSNSIHKASQLEPK